MAYMRDANGRRLDSIAVPGSPAKRTATFPLTAPNSQSATLSRDLTQRSMFRVPFGVSRARLCFANRNLRATTALTTACTITGIWTGTPVRDTATTGTGRWKGDCSAALTQRVATPLTVPVDRSIVRSPWFDLTDYRQGSDLVISWGLTSGSTGTGIANGNGYQGVSAAGAANAGAATLTGASVGTNVVLLDVWVEYEFTAPVKVILTVGDSRTVQYGLPPALIAGADGGSLPTEAWPALVSAMTGAAVINLGVGSAVTTDFTTSFPDIWTRLPQAGVTVDAVIVALGTNQLGSANLANFITPMQALNAYIRTTIGCDTIWWATITPRAYPDGAYTSGGTIIGGTLTAPAAAAATTITTSFTAATGATVLGIGPSAEDVTISSVSGTTATLSTALVNAHATGEPIGQGQERTRKLINNYLRQMPDGISGVIDFEKLVESSPGSATMDARYVGSDYLHSPRNAGAPMAGLAAPLAVRPLLT